MCIARRGAVESCKKLATAPLCLFVFLSIRAASFNNSNPGTIPIKRTLSMRLTGLKYRPSRLVLSIILALISFTFFCYDYNEYNYEYVTNDYLVRWLNGEHIMSYAFVCDGYYAKNFPFSTSYEVLYKLSGNISKDKKLIDKISYSYYVECLPEESLDTYSRFDYSISATYRTRYSGFADETEFLRDETFLTIATVVSVCFAIFGALLLMSFLSVNMDARKREFGILRALGARVWDIVKICLTESLAIAYMDFVLTLISTSIVCLVLNIKYNFWLFGIGIIPLLSLMLLCFGVAALATIIPTVRLARKRPIDIINNK